MIITKNPECEFCNELTGGKINSFRSLIPENIIASRFIRKTDNFAAFPTIGALMAGYLLVIPKEHIYNIGQIRESQFSEFESLVNELRSIVEKIYSKKTILFEHGSTRVSKSCGSCIDHAHLHICPVHEDLEKFIRIDNSTQYHIGSMSELQGWCNCENGYLYYEGLNNQKLVYELSENLSSQYLRKILAKSICSQESWDWAIDPMIENIISTVEDLSLELGNDNIIRSKKHRHT